MMKKLLFTFFVSAALFLSFDLVNASASTTKIDQETFPDDTFRQYVLEKIDTDHDGYLSQSEKDNCKQISIVKFILDADEVHNEGDNYAERPVYTKNDYVFDFKGIGWFKKCTSIIINLNRGFGLTDKEDGSIYTAQIKNLDSLYKCKSLTSLSLANGNLTTIDLSKFPKLSTFNIVSYPKLKSINGKNSNLTDFYGSGLDTLKSINLANYKNLKTFKLGDANNVSKISIRNKKLTSFIIDQSTNVYNTKMTSLDFSGAPNLKAIDINYVKNLSKMTTAKNKEVKKFFLEGLPSLSSVSLKNNTKLEQIVIWNCKKLKTLDLSNSKKVNRIIVDGCALSSIKLNRSNKVNFIRWANDSKMTKLNVTNLKYSPLTTLQVFGNKKLSSVDVRSYKKLKDLYITKAYTKVIKKSSQNIQIYYW